MPQVVGALIISAATAAEVAAAAGTIGVTISGAAVQSALGSLVIASASIGLSYALRPKPKPNESHIAIRSPISPRQFIYGRTRNSGAYMLYEASNNGWSVDVIALHSGKICGFVQFLLHEDRVVINPGTNAVEPVDGATDGRYSEDDVYIYSRRGEAPETAYAEVIEKLPEGIWTTDHRLDGTASIALLANGVRQKDFQKLYPNGKPEPSAVIDGLAIWDPRDPAQDPDDPDTWVDYPAYDIATTYAAGARVLFGGAPYISRIDGNIGVPPWVQVTGNPIEAMNGAIVDNHDEWVSVIRNPVLQTIDYLTHPDHGMGLDRDVLITPVLSALIVEANLCDDLVQKKDLDYEPRYQSSGVGAFDTAPNEILGAILATCDGWMTESGDGTLALKVGVYRAPTVTFTDRHRLPGFSIAYGVADEQKINDLALSFTSIFHKYKELPGESWRDETDIAERGKVRSQPLSLTWVHSHSQGRRLAKRAFARVSGGTFGTFTTTLYGLRGLGERYVGVQFSFFAGLTDAVVEIQSAEVDLAGGKITWNWMLIDPATIDDWDPDTEEGTAPPLADDVSLTGLPVPQNVTATIEGDATVGWRFEITFDDPDRTDLEYVVRYRLTNDGTGNPGPWIDQYASDPIADGFTVTISTTVVQGDAEYLVEVASVGTAGGFSDWSDPVTVVSADILLREDGSALLREDGTFILRETA